MKKRIKNSVAIVATDDRDQFLVVQRPLDEAGPLAGVWGFPAITCRAGESEQAAAQRVALAKLGVSVRVGSKIGERTADRGDYVLHLSDYAVTVLDGTPTVPQADTSITQYVNHKYTDDPKVLLPAARHGSLCSQVFLVSKGIDWHERTTG